MTPRKLASLSDTSDIFKINSQGIKPAIKFMKNWEAIGNEGVIDKMLVAVRGFDTKIIKGSGKLC